MLGKRVASASRLAGEREPKREEVARVEDESQLLVPRPGEPMAHFFARLRSAANREVFRVVDAFDADGIYLYKRPVRSSEGQQVAELLALCGSVFQHCVVYVKRGGELVALEYGPGNQMDITADVTQAVPPAPVVLRPAPEPEPECLPMLHIAAPAHSLDAEAVAAAVRFCERDTLYHAIFENCIAFADFMVRLLTGGGVCGAPLLFDALAGRVPPQDPPMLPFMLSMVGLSGWHVVVDGGRLMARFLARHPAALVPPAGRAALRALRWAAEEEEGEAAEAASSDSADTAVPAGSTFTSRRRASPVAPRGLRALPPRRPSKSAACSEVGSS
eukprot:scaffold14.g1331.t1